jgi:hypothetical protein
MAEMRTPDEMAIEPTGNSSEAADARRPWTAPRFVTREIEDTEFSSGPGTDSSLFS